MSYGYAELDFSNIRKALIVGMNNGNSANGNNSGKSNLFQAIGWAVWGESRASILDGNVRWGTKECSVELWFEHDGHEAYIKRTRNSDNGTTNLIFSIDGEDSKSGKSATQTDKKILEFVKLDYLTYVNSVYIRQEDIYSLANPQRPNQGREVLEQILKLDIYDDYEKTTKNKIKEVEKSITEYEFFIEANKNIVKKIEEVKTEMLETSHFISENIKEYELASVTLEETEKKYQEQKKYFDSYNSIAEQISRSKSIITNKNSEIERNKEKGKVEVVNREVRKDSLIKKIKEKTNIEKDREAFLNEMLISDGYKKEFDKLSEDLIIEKQSFEVFNKILRTKENEKIGLQKDIKFIHDELDKIKFKVKNIKVSAGEKCESCMREVTEHSVEDIKKHYKEKYVNKINELEPIVKAFEELEKNEKELNNSILTQKSKILEMEKNINVLRGKIITQKQYEDRLMVFSTKLLDITRYEAELENLPEDKIIGIIALDIKKIKSEIESEELHQSELQKQLDGINVDIKALNKLSEQIEINTVIKEDKFRIKYTLEANQKNFAKNLEEYETVNQQLKLYNDSLNACKIKLIVLEQLEKGFGSKGVRAKIIEDSIREIEIETNIMLKRLSKLSVSFITERNGKVVFEVDVHDGPKTLEYALYSGSEHFRIAFSLRVALAKLLMRRANSKLDFLLIDEADASLDEHNAEEIVNIINELQDEFYMILCISHRNDIKSQFENIITVSNDGEKSTII